MPHSAHNLDGDLLPALRAAAGELAPEELAAPILVGVSGGPDSLALLHLLRRWAGERGTTIRAIVVDHALRPESAGEAARVAALCRGWGIAVAVRVVRPGVIAAGREGVEDAARRERYRLFAEEARSVGALTVALGHQANDQAETLLLHLLRGVGLAGLTGMPTVRRAGDLLDRHANPGAAGELPSRPALWRPLLGVGRAAIEAYCRTWELTPTHDPTNDDPILRRNGVRHRLLPLAEELFPGATATLARGAILLADDEDLLRRATDDAWVRCAQADGALVLLDRATFRAEHPALQRRLLRRAWTEVRGVETAAGLGAAPIEAARQGIAAARGGGHRSLPGGLVVVVERERAAVGLAATIEEELRQRLTVPLVGPGWSAPLPKIGIIGLSAGWAVQLVPADTAPPGGAYCPLPALDAASPPLILRTWQPGDRFVLPDGRGTQKLQDWFVDHHIPRYARRHLIVLAAGERIFWIAGLAAFLGANTAPHRSDAALRLLYNGASSGATKGRE